MSAARKEELLKVRAEIEQLKAKVQELEPLALGSEPQAQLVSHRVNILGEQILELRKQETKLLDPPADQTQLTSVIRNELRNQRDLEQADQTLLTSKIAEMIRNEMRNQEQGSGHLKVH